MKNKDIIQAFKEKINRYQKLINKKACSEKTYNSITDFYGYIRSCLGNNLTNNGLACEGLFNEYRLEGNSEKGDILIRIKAKADNIVIAGYEVLIQQKENSK